MAPGRRRQNGCGMVVPMIDVQVATALAPLPAPYHEHLRRIVDVVEPDQRIRGLWLSGSIARGTADAGSDLDLLLAIADDEFDTFIDHWRGWLVEISPTLVAKDIPGSRLIMYALTEDICRIDAVVEPVGKLAESPHRTRLTVLDRDDLTGRVPRATAGPGPSLERVTMIIEEFWRIQSIFPTMLDGRRDLLCAQSGIRSGTQLLYDTFVECNQPLPPMGVKQFSARLTDAQTVLLESLPAASAERTSLITANRALCDAMATQGREAAVQVGARYPERLASAVQIHHATTL